MKISLIAAVSSNNGIGLDNKLLWDIKEDMNWFKQHTANKPVVMGRKTYESIGKPLKGRLNIVLTRDSDLFLHPDVHVCGSIHEVFYKFQREDELVVIGGAEIYKQFLPYASELYLTEIDQQMDADTFFPELVAEEWSQVSQRSGIEQVGFDYTFKVYQRNEGWTSDGG